MDILPIFIMLCCLIGITIISIVSYRTIKKLKDKQNEQKQKLYDLCIDILNLDYLIVIDKKSGLNIYSQNFMEKEIDAALISGFLQAIHSFGIDIINNEAQSNVKSLEYKDSIFLMCEYNNLRLVLIMKEKPSRSFIELIEKLTHDIYKNFGDLIDNFSGDIQQFKAIENLVNESLDMNLLHSHIPSKMKLGEIEKEFLEKALKMSRLTQLEKEKVNQIKERLKGRFERWDGDDFFLPYPYIFKPPGPPDAGAEARLKPQYIPPKNISERISCCKHCSAELPDGQLICHACGKKV